ncbi:TPA: exodeoxyribonuclease VII large subunit, partial [Stenotrophomonas maltophilia]
HPQRQLDAMQRRLAALRGRPQAAMQRLLERDALRLRGLARSLEAVSPLATVARGYSILTRSDDGALVRHIDQVQPGDALQARVGDGVIDVQVK